MAERPQFNPQEMQANLQALQERIKALQVTLGGKVAEETAVEPPGQTPKSEVKLTPAPTSEKTGRAEETKLNPTAKEEIIRSLSHNLYVGVERVIALEKLAPQDLQDPEIQAQAEEAMVMMLTATNEYGNQGNRPEMSWFNALVKDFQPSHERILRAAEASVANWLTRSGRYGSLEELEELFKIAQEISTNLDLPLGRLHSAVKEALIALSNKGWGPYRLIMLAEKVNLPSEIIHDPELQAAVKKSLFTQLAYPVIGDMRDELEHLLRTFDLPPNLLETPEVKEAARATIIQYLNSQKDYINDQKTGEQRYHYGFDTSHTQALSHAGYMFRTFKRDPELFNQAVQRKIEEVIEAAKGTKLEEEVRKSIEYHFEPEIEEQNT